MAEPNINPDGQYSEATLAAMRSALAADQARKDAALADLRIAFKAKVDALVKLPEYTAMVNALSALDSDPAKDDIYSFYVAPALLNLKRLAGN